MKTISLRELHAKTGAWVRKAARLGTVLITDRGIPIARIEPVAHEVSGNPFSRRRILPEFAVLKGKLAKGSDSTSIIRADRDER